MGSLSFEDFVSVVGLNPDSLQVHYTVTRDVEKGKQFAFRYRTRNIIGPGEWSDIS